MPSVARIGDTISTGHGCDGTTTLTSPSTNVFANSKGIERQGDPTVVHRLTGRGCSVTHTAVIKQSEELEIQPMPVLLHPDHQMYLPIKLTFDQQIVMFNS
jgi:uncharacterized Zn-binding protein involved in type VI secretion